MSRQYHVDNGVDVTDVDLTVVIYVGAAPGVVVSGSPEDDVDVDIG